MKILLIIFVILFSISGCTSGRKSAVPISPVYSTKTLVNKEIIKGKKEIPFADKNSVFTEVSGYPEYIIGPGDILTIYLYKGMNVDKYTVKVKGDGSISFIFLEDIKASGITPSELKRLLEEKLSSYIRKPKIDVQVKEYHSKKVYLLGAINILPRMRSGPGVYILKGKTTILELLSKAGGPARDADLRTVQVTRRGKIFYVNLYKVIAEGNIEENVVLDNNDSIFIPSIKEAPNKVIVLGEVKNPGVYPLRKGTSVIDAIAQAGGYTKVAKLEEVKIIRGDISNPMIIDSNIDKFIKEGDIGSNLKLSSNDILYVPRSKIGNWNDFIAKIKPTIDLLLSPIIGARIMQDILQGD
jgi:polysaccharide export outer membrane protein